jgi:hypothetical protein
MYVKVDDLIDIEAYKTEIQAYAKYLKEQPKKGNAIEEERKNFKFETP